MEKPPMPSPEQTPKKKRLALSRPGRLVRGIVASIGLHGAAMGTPTVIEQAPVMAQKVKAAAGELWHHGELTKWKESLKSTEQAANDDPLKFYLHAEHLSGGRSEEEENRAVAELKKRRALLAKKYQQFVRSEGLTDEAIEKYLQALIDTQGAYEEKSSSLTRLLNEGVGNCEARAKYFYIMLDQGGVDSRVSVERTYQLLLVDHVPHMRLLTRVAGGSWYALDGRPIRVTDADLDGTAILTHEDVVKSYAGKSVQARMTTAKAGETGFVNVDSKQTDSFLHLLPDKDFARLKNVVTQQAGAPGQAVESEGDESMEVTFMDEKDLEERKKQKAAEQKKEKDKKMVALTSEQVLNAKITGTLDVYAPTRHSRMDLSAIRNVPVKSVSIEGGSFDPKPLEGKQLNEMQLFDMIIDQKDSDALKKVAIKKLIADHSDLELGFLQGASKKTLESLTLAYNRMRSGGSEATSFTFDDLRLKELSLHASYADTIGILSTLNVAGQPLETLSLSLTDKAPIPFFPINHLTQLKRVHLTDDLLDPVTVETFKQRGVEVNPT